MATSSFINDMKFSKQEVYRLAEIIEEQSNQTRKNKTDNTDTMNKVKRGKELLDTLFPN